MMRSTESSGTKGLGSRHEAEHDHSTLVLCEGRSPLARTNNSRPRGPFLAQTTPLKIGFLVEIRPLCLRKSTTSQLPRGHLSPAHLLAASRCLRNLRRGSANVPSNTRAAFGNAGERRKTRNTRGGGIEEAARPASGKKGGEVMGRRLSCPLRIWWLWR